MTQETVESWLRSFRQTALDRDLEGHMAHISKDVGVFGVPGFDVLGFQDWRQQCAHEFPQGLIRNIDYAAPLMRVDTADRMMFKTLETTHTSDGGIIAQALEFVLQLEAGEWRLKQLRILPADEASHDGLI